MLLGVYGFGLSLLLGRGTYKMFLYVCAVAVAGMLWNGRGKITLDRPVGWMLGFGAVFLVQGLIMAGKPVAGDFHWVLGWSMLVASAVTLLPERVTPRISHWSVMIVMMVVFVLFHGGAYLWWSRQTVTVYGLQGAFKNPHYLAMYAMLTIIVLFFLVFENRGWLRWALIPVLLGDLWLLGLTGSHPTALAMASGLLVLLPFFSARVSGTVIAAILLTVLGLQLGGLYDFSAKFQEAVDFLEHEERWTIWREFWMLQNGGSAWQWGFGHGLGQFFWDYQPVSSFHANAEKQDFASPHNYLLEMLYSHGVTGLALFILAGGLWFKGLLAGISASRTPEQRHQGWLLLSLTTAQWVLGFFTMPFFSRHNLYPVSLLLGLSLRYVIDTRRNA